MAWTRHTDEPGTPAWHARRARCFNAGDASAMLGCHPSGKTRTQLLQELHSGIEREFSDYVQERVVAPGHRIEALWRPIAEEILGEDLQVLAGSLEVGLSRPLGASLDGITFMEDVLSECKSANEALRAALPHVGRASHLHNDARQLPKGYRVQMEQQQLVTGATRTLFSAMDFDAGGNCIEERHAFYTSDPALRAEILAGWKQLDADRAAYVPPGPAAVEKIVAEPVEALPEVSVRVEGAIVVHENFDVFEGAMRDFLEHRLIREPKTDQQFADLERQIKALKGAEAALDRAEASWIAQIETVSEKKRRKDMLRALVRDNRLMAEKLLATEKERRKGDIVAGGVKALADHVAALNQRLGERYMPTIPADFGGCIKGLKHLESMEDRVATELARAKIAANEVADRIQVNMRALVAAGDRASFPDASSLVLKDPDDLRAIIAARVAEVERKEAARLEAERARIRAEEEARARAQAQREQQERQEAENALVESFHLEARRIEFDSVPYIQKAITAYESTAKDWENDPRERVRSAYLAGREYLKDRLEAAERRQRDEEAARAEQQRQQQAAPADFHPITLTDKDGRTELATASTAIVRQLPPRQSPLVTPPTLKLGDINQRIGLGKWSEEDLRLLGFPAASRERNACMYHEQDFKPILAAIAQHMVAVANGQKAVA